MRVLSDWAPVDTSVHNYATGHNTGRGALKPLRRHVSLSQASEGRRDKTLCCDVCHSWILSARLEFVLLVDRQFRVLIVADLGFAIGSFLASTALQVPPSVPRVLFERDPEDHERSPAIIPHSSDLFSLACKLSVDKIG